MTLQWQVRGDDVDAVAATAASEVDAAGARAPFLSMWLRIAAQQLQPDEQAHIVLDYDDKAGLVSFDAWVGDRRIYGADDFVG